jgi:HPt (histidine-containing phosphotransfer) domain-containing protein
MRAETNVPRPDDRPTLDPRSLTALRALDSPGEPSVLGELVSGFLGSLPEWVAALRDATARLDRPLLERAAHSFRGSSGMLGALRLHDLLGLVEEDAQRGEVEAASAQLGEVEREAADVGEALRRAVETTRFPDATSS